MLKSSIRGSSRKRIWTLLICLSILVTSLSSMCVGGVSNASTVQLQTSTSVVFPDVSPSDTHYAAISMLSDNRIIVGYTDGKFKPDNSITRSEFATIMCRVMRWEDELSSTSTTTAFTDVADSHWAAKYINVALNKNIIMGIGNSKFNPDGLVTFEQAITMVVRALNYDNEALRRGAWPQGHLAVGNELGLNANTSGASSVAASRGTLAQIVYNANFLLPQWTVKVNGSTVSTLDYAAKTVIVRNTVLMPLSFFTEKLGINRIEETNSRIQIEKNGITLTFINGNSGMKVNTNLNEDIQQPVDVEARITSSTSMLPLKSVLKCLGYTSDVVNMGSRIIVIDTSTVKPPPPLFSKDSGNYASSFSLTLTSPNNSIFYTTNGSTPTQNSTRYNGPITVGETMTVKAIAVSSSGAESDFDYRDYMFGEEVDGITVSPASAQITVGKTVFLSATVYPQDIIDRSITWSSSDASVATVSNGAVTGVKVGTATITATSGIDSTKSAICTVMVVKEGEVIVILSSNSESLDMVSKKTVQLTATVENSDNKSVTWSSSNSSVATVSSSGLVTAQAAGNATITATSSEDNTKTAFCEVSVIEEPVSGQYTVAYNANGGNNAPASQNKAHDVPLTLTSSVPTRTYSLTYNTNGGSVFPSSEIVSCGFDRWTTNKEGSGTQYKSGTVYRDNASIILYAQWIIYGKTLPIPNKSYSITYDANGGEVYLSRKTVDCIFDGWKDNSSLTGSSWNVYLPSSPASKTFYAKWMNPASGLLPTPTKSGYNFNGWYTVASGGTQVSSNTTITADMTVYAQWTAAPATLAPKVTLKSGSNYTVTMGENTNIQIDVVAPKERISGSKAYVIWIGFQKSGSYGWGTEDSFYYDGGSNTASYVLDPQGLGLSAGSYSMAVGLFDSNNYSTGQSIAQAIGYLTVKEASDTDFEISNGVLVKYRGSGGDVMIPSGVTSIGESAFYACEALKSVHMSNGVTSIGERAFMFCTNLTSITIPNSVTSIGHWAFDSCSALRTVNLSNNMTSIGERVFSNCGKLDSIIIPNSIKSIGGAAFAGCSSLTLLTIPNKVANIGGEAFYHCTGLVAVYFEGNAPAIGKRIFDDVHSNFKIYYPKGTNGWTNPWNGYATQEY